MASNPVLEVLFVTSSNDQQISCSALDYRTGTNLINYKGGSGGAAASRTLCLVNNDFILTANISKPLLHLWPINKQDAITNVRFVMPGIVTAMAISPDQCYLIAGIQETIYLWNINTGRMLNNLSKHYQAVTCVRFTDDGEYFVSGGKDGAVLVWSITTLIARYHEDGENQEPLYSFNDHGLPVTDIHVGAGSLKSYIYTASLDRTCKIYDLLRGMLLLCVVFPDGLESIVVNALETKGFVGTNAGNIFEFNMIKAPRVKEFHVEGDCEQFTGHSSTSVIKCLTLSLDGQTLISGSDDGQLLIWHISSRQLIKTIGFKGSINNIYIQLSNYMKFDAEYKPRNIFKNSFKRMIDPPEAIDEEEITVLVDANNYITYNDENYLNHDFLPLPLDYLFESSNKQHHSTSAMKTVRAKHKELSSSTAVIVERQSDIESLKMEVERLRLANKKLFELSVKQIFKKNK